MELRRGPGRPRAIRAKEAQAITNELKSRQKAIEDQPYKIRQFAGYLTGSQIRVTWMTTNQNGGKVAMSAGGHGSQMFHREQFAKGTVTSNNGRILVFEYQNDKGLRRRETVTVNDYVAGWAKVELLERGCGGHV